MKLLSALLTIMFLVSCLPDAQEKENPLEGVWREIEIMTT